MEASTLMVWLAGGLLPLSLIAFHLGRRKAASVRSQGRALHSQPEHYGWFAAIGVVLPSLALVLLGSVLDVTGLIDVPPAMHVAASLALAAGGVWATQHAIRPELRARNINEGVIRWLMMAASLVSIVTTIGIVLSILFEAIRFFQVVSLWEFLTGTTWAPDTAFVGAAGASEPQFGAVPLFAGTFMVTFIAMCVAIPIGVLSAIYMAELAPGWVRSVAKPALEVLAAIPTVVYGFFAAITIAPLLVSAAEWVGLEASFNNALAPGLVMGIMIVPLVSSLSDDVIGSVPNSMREGSYALGMTETETIKHVVVPAALPGIIAAFLLAVSRALGETMIVVMAAGLRPNLTANPLEDMTTVTVRIVDALTGDQAFDSAETLSAFALGLVLFVMTLVLNLISTICIHRFRQRYQGG